MPTHYRVEPGDTLSALALRFYGDANLFPVIARANGLPNPHFILAGQLLTIPDLVPPPHPPTADPARVFALRRGADRIRLHYDTLLAEADDKEAGLHRTRQWAATNPTNVPHGNTAQSILRRAETEQAARRKRLDELHTQLEATTAELAASLDAGTPLFPLRRHTMRDGDTLFALARRFYGNGQLWPLIARANNIDDPNTIPIGTVVVIPEAGREPTRTHTVRSGEVLFDLAQRFYGNPELWPLIAQANGIIEPRRLQIGTVLVIPERPGGSRRTHTMRDGDTLFALARRFYGNAELWPVIAQANDIDDPNTIPTGKVIVIPDLSPTAVEPIALLPVRIETKFLPDDIRIGQVLVIPEREAPVRRHTVVSGDTLSALALRFYGDATLFPLIAQANGLVNPHRIRVGQVLVIPAREPHPRPVTRTHTVVAGDTLASIAQAAFGDAGAADLIAAANGIAERTIQVRVYPDDIHIDAFAPELTPEERDLARTYWANPGDIAWQELLTKLSPQRAAWATRQTRPGAPEPRLRDAQQRRAPQVTTMPSRWRFLGFVDGALVVDSTGADIPDPLPLGLLEADVAARDHEHAAWAVDFPAAVAAGMGITLTLPEGIEHLDELFVVGVSERSAAESAARLRNTLLGHAFGGGLGFLTAGTPTNNTPESRTAWSARPSSRAPGPAAPSFVDGADAARVAEALGIADGEFLMECDGGQLDSDAAVAGLSLLSWDALAFGFVDAATNVLGVADTEFAQLSGRAWIGFRDHLVDYVRGRGPLPTIRVGRQPYGILPVSTVDEWRSHRKDAPDALLAPWLLRLRDHWRGALISGWIPRVTDGQPADRLAVDVMTRLPVSNNLVIRRVLSPAGGLEKFDKMTETLDGLEIGRRAPGPVLSVGGIDFRSGLRWATPTPLISHLAWTSDRTPADFAKVAERLTPNAKGYPEFFGRSRRHLADALAILEEGIPEAEYERRIAAYDEKWPIPVLHGEQDERKPDLFGFPGDEDFIPALTFKDNPRTHLFDEASEPLRDALDIPGLIDDLIIQKVSRPDTPRDELDAKRDHARGKRAGAAAVLAGLAALEQVPADRFLPLLMEILDIYSHRWDAWATSLATKRLADTRGAGATGVRLGGYGWVENLRRNPPSRTVSDGYIHAPSQHHAATAAVLRSGFLAHDRGGSLAVDLTSRRARTARWLLGGVRRGQNLGALLGYRFERALHDANLDQLKDFYRRHFPTPVVPEPADGQEEPELWRRSADAIAPVNVVDGMALARAHAEGNLAIPDGRARPMLDDLVDALDAVGDLLLAESVHQLVGGNPMRAGIAADTLGQGTDVPDRFDVLRTPHRGSPITHRAAALLPADPALPAGWARDAFAKLEPRVEAWVAAVLGPATGWRLSAQRVGSATTFSFTADELEFGALGFALDVASDAHRRLDLRVAQLAGFDSDAIEYGGDWLELMQIARRVQRLLGSARALTPAQLVGEGATGLAPDMAEVRGRLRDFVDTVTSAQNRAALGIDADPERLARAVGETDDASWVGAVTLALGDFLGTGVPIAPLLGGAAIPAAQPGIRQSSIADWVRRFATIRPATRAWHETLMLAGARSGRPCPLSVSQLPAGGPWIGAPFTPTERPGAREHLVTHRPFPVPSNGRVAGIVFDEWVEVLPGSYGLSPTKAGPDAVPVESELTGVSFHFDRPDAKAPQAILLAVPPDAKRGWTADVLAMVVRDTLELAKLRAVDLGDLPLLDDILPVVRPPVFSRPHSILHDFWLELAE
ncbi:LysM peptidoglycan-binding domain-containing protein [Nocardia sp. NPDC050793]|uniref:LysM peptidoglycan-binding domain-containing protein n=1 Tax=Nocardia sp. NPDC050793 TaxID=3155159 RepID=UPI0033D4CEFE